MLSSEHPSSGPSCSSKSVAPGASADPATFPVETPAPAPAHRDPADLVQPRPKFSIRDYVFDSRSKGIKRSWPFHPQSLELCLKRGVKDLLPPFEPPDLIRSRSLYTCIDFEQSAMCSEADVSVGLVKTRDVGSSNVNTTVVNSQSCQSVDESHGQAKYTPMDHGESATDQGGNTNEPDHTEEVIQAGQQDNSCTKAIRRTKVAVASCRSKNLGSSRETPEKKCKLLVKSVSVTNIRQTKDVAPNSSSVPDPKASKTCPVCKVFASTSNTTLNAHIDQCLSVESNTDLVVETVFVKPKVKPRKKHLMVDIYKTALPYTLEDLDRRNGTNWAIELAVPTVNKEVCTKNRSPEVVPFEARDGERDLDVYVDSNGIKIRILSKSSDAPSVLRDELSSRKVAKHEIGKSISMSKTFLKSKTFRNKKFKVHGKKCNKLNHLNSQVQAYPDGDIHDDTSEEEPAMHIRQPTGSTCCGGSETMRQWVCSKRSDLAKNFSRKLTNKAPDNTTLGTKKLVRSRMLGFDDPQITESHIEAFSSQPPEEMATTSKVNDDDQGNGSLRLIGSIPRLSSKDPSSSNVMPKVPRSAAAVAKRKIKEIGRREAYKSDNYDTVRSSTLDKSSEAYSISFPIATSKIFQKHRSLLRTRRREFSPSISGLVHGFGEDHEPDHRHVNKKFWVSNGDPSKKVVKHTQEDTADNDFSYGSNVPELGQGDDQYYVAQQTASTHMDYEGEEPATEVQYASASRNTLEDCCSEIISGSLSPENSKTADVVLAKGCSVAMEDPCSTEQLTHHVSNIVANNEMEEWQIDPAPTKESSACFTNNRDMGLGAPQDNSSITSNRQDSNQDHGLAFDRDLPDSPISTMSPPIGSKEDSRTKESEAGPSIINVRTVEESMSGSSNQETKSMPLAREGEQLPNEKPFCCSCRESISRESELHHQSATARSATLPRKQVPQLQIGLRTSSSFSTYQRTDTKANPCLGSHDQPLTARVSSESTVGLPSYMTDCMRPSLQTQLPSPSSPMLRLMGKNLMVMNSEESGHPQALNSDYKLRGNYMAPVGFMPPNYQHSDSAFINATPSITSHQIPIASVQAGNFVRPPLHGGSMAQSNHHSLQEPYRNLVPIMHHPTYMMKEVIMINDSPECRSGPQVGAFPNTMVPRPFYYLPSPSQIFPRESGVGSLPVFTNISPMVVVSSSSQRKQVICHNPYMSNPLHVNSPTGYINPPAQYFQNLR